jgi:hypothetical protein
MKRMLLVVATCLGASVAAFADEPRTPEAAAVVAVEACHAGLRAALKTPATARFDEKPTVTRRYGGYPWAFDVVGSVDSQNSFGALLRLPFGCHTEYVGAAWRTQIAVEGKSYTVSVDAN